MPGLSGLPFRAAALHRPLEVPRRKARSVPKGYRKRDGTPTYVLGNFIDSDMTSNVNVCGDRRVTHGFDVTDSVQLRMTNGKNGTKLDSEQTDAVVVRNALTSLRKEAIWQYCVRRLRGFLFWTLDQSIAHVPRPDLASASWRPTLPFMAHLSAKSQARRSFRRTTLVSEAMRAVNCAICKPVRIAPVGGQVHLSPSAASCNIHQAACCLVEHCQS